MRCDEAVRRLLEADVEELTTKASTALSDHMQGCARCGALAREILEGQEALDLVLIDLVRDAEGAVDSIPFTRRGRWLRAAAGLAAAAALAWFLLSPPGHPTGPTVVTPAESGADRVPRDRPIGDRIAGGAGASRVPTVSPSPGHSAAVLQTSNPRISFVWIEPLSQ